MQAEHQHAILGLRLVERLLERQAAVAGLEFILERTRMLRAAPLSAASCTVSATSQNQRSASGNARCSAWALATETSRSLLVPPKRMVVRISLPLLSSFRGDADPDSNLEIRVRASRAPE